MVYCGKASPKCAGCRRRRIKCDLNPEGCGQCKRAHQSCPGYRNVTDTAFRDQTQHTIDRVTASVSEVSPSTSRSRSPVSPGSLEHSSSRSCPGGFSDAILPGVLVAAWNGRCSTLSSYMPPSLDQVATTVFYNQYLDLDTDIKSSFILDPFLSTDTVSPLSEAIKALGTLSIPQSRFNQTLTIKARKNYASALRLTNQALTNPSRAKADDILLTILLLSMWEMIAFDGPNSLVSWNIHVEGATKLLEIRGPEALQSPLGLVLFGRLRGQLLISCLSRDQQVPNILLNLAQTIKADEVGETSNLANGLASIASRLCALRVEIRKGFLTDDEISHKLLGLDYEAELWEHTLPSHYEYNQLHKSNTADSIVYGETYHMYQSATAAMILNNYRAIRVMLNIDFLLLSNNNVSSEWLSEARAKSLENLISLSTDIAGSIPWILGSESEAPFTVTQGLSVMWFLYIVAEAGQMLPESLFRWVIEQLRRLYRVAGIGQAAVMADLVEKGEEIAVWGGMVRRSLYAPRARLLEKAGPDSA